MGSYSFVDIVLLIGIAQGVFLSMALPMIQRRHITTNRVLTLLLLLACLSLLTRMVIYKADDIKIVQRISVLETFIFVFGPLGYIYLKRLLESGRQEFMLSWVHYIPALVYFSYLVFLNFYSDEEFGWLLRSGSFKIPFFIAESAALVFNWYYWYLNIRFFKRFMQQEPQQLSFSQKAIPFIKIVLFMVGTILVAWLVSYLCTYIFHIYLPIINYNSIWILIPVLIYVVGFFALRQPEIFRVSITNNVPNAGLKARLDGRLVQDLKHRLDLLVERDQVYLDNELTLVALSKKLETSTNNLSWLLNNVYETNFYDFINGYRVAAFVSKIENKEHRSKTLFSMSLEVGFNSKSTFNKAFKSILKETPSAYIKKMGT